MRLKSMVGTAIAAAALSVPYSASAAIAVNTDAPPLAEAFLAVWDVSNGNTYIQDLGINATTTNWSTATFTATVNSTAYSSMFGASTASNLRYGVYAGLNNETGIGGPPQDYLFFTAATGTNTSSWLTAAPFGDLGQNLTRLDLLTNAHNTSNDYSVNSTTTATSGAGSIGDNPGNVFNGSLTDAPSRVANGLIGTALSWFQIGLDENTNGTDLNVRNTFQNWSFDGATLTYGGAPVPLPAGIWLLGSALLGLVGVSRRRSQVA